MSSSDRKLFGTDGIRGRANSYPMTAETALKLGRALTVVLKEHSIAPKIIVGKDTRLSCYMLETAFTAGVTSMGGTAYLLGPLPTPAVGYLIRAMRAHGGVMISASHNPYYDNGLKVFGADGFKLDDAAEARLEKLMLGENEITELRPTPEKLGRARRLEDAQGRYLTHLKTIFGRDFDLSGVKIVFDGANGAAYDCGRKLFEELGAEVIPVACSPNGTNINADCAHSDPRLLTQKVLDEGADIGIAVDGDADRLMVCDELGRMISGEHLLFGMATYLKQLGRLQGNGVVSTSMANQALENALRAEGITLHRAAVGDRYVTEMMREKHLILGGETSGHFIFLDQNTAADGLFSALEILALLKVRDWKTSQLMAGFQLLPSKLLSIKVPERVPLTELPKTHAFLQSLEKKYAADGRIVVRYSGTEYSLRIMCEGPNAVQVEGDAHSLGDLAKQEIELLSKLRFSFEKKFGKSFGTQTGGEYRSSRDSA